MIGTFIVGYILMALIVFMLFWPLFVSSSDANDKMEELLKEKKAQDIEHINRLDR